MASKHVHINEAMSDAALGMGQEDLDAHDKIRRTRPEKSQLLDARGGKLSERKGVKDGWKISFDMRTEKGRKGFQEALEAMRPAMKLEAERAEQLQSKLDNREYRDKEGRKTFAPASLEDAIGRASGMRRR